MSCSVRAEGQVWGSGSVIQFNGMSIEDCCAACDIRAICKAWTYDEAGSVCYLKNNTFTNTTQINHVSGLRSSTWTPPRACSTDATSFPFCDPALSLDARLDDLIARIPDDSKAAFLTARGWPQGTQVGIPSLGVPPYNWGVNCLHSVGTTCAQGFCSTMFPMPVCFLRST